jgi:acyl-CoA synthetase (AMP-forming)/AMP-acid ligase II
MLIGDIIRANARLYPDKPGIIDEENRYTWSEFNARVNRLAGAMLAAGGRPGDRAAILCENRHEFAEFVFASAKSGIVGAYINHRFMPEKISAMLQDAAPRLILIQDKFKDLLPQITGGLDDSPEVIVIGDGGDYEARLAAAPDTEPAYVPAADDVCVVLFSTGPTGTPKGMELTHRTWVANATTRLWVTRGVPEDIYLIATPFFTAGSLAHFFGAAYSGNTVVTCAFSGEAFARMIARERVSTTFLSPAVFKLARDYVAANPEKYDLSCLKKLAVAGGQPCMRDQLREMLDFFNIPYGNSSKTYSMSEIATVGNWLLPHELVAGLAEGATEKEQARLNSIGKPVGATRVRVVDDADRDLPPWETGEILFQSDGLMRGYLNRPELNQRVMRGGWYHTGDLGRFDEDGYLYLVGRQDFLIKSGGFFVSAEEVEKVIMTHPAVAEVGVLGIPHQQWGEMVKAVVGLKPDAEVSIDEIRNHCRGSLSGFQVPKLVEFVASLPRESTFGKLSRTELARLYGEAVS